MTDVRLNEVAQLINTQGFKLSQLKSAIEIALGDGFLDLSKSTIYNHWSMIDDKLSEVIEINGDVVQILK